MLTYSQDYPSDIWTMTAEKGEGPTHELSMIVDPSAIAQQVVQMSVKSNLSCLFNSFCLCCS